MRARSRARGEADGGVSASPALNPQSLRALMTARHDPPGKILGDHGAGDIKYATRVESTVMCREATRGDEGDARLRETRLFMANGLSNRRDGFSPLLFAPPWRDGAIPCRCASGI